MTDPLLREILSRLPQVMLNVLLQVTPVDIHRVLSESQSRWVVAQRPPLLWITLNILCRQRFDAHKTPPLAHIGKGREMPQNRGIFCRNLL